MRLLFQNTAAKIIKGFIALNTFQRFHCLISYFFYQLLLTILSFEGLQVATMLKELLFKENIEKIIKRLQYIYIYIYNLSIANDSNFDSLVEFLTPRLKK